MKIEKLNKKQIELNNSAMHKVIGGAPKVGDTRFSYSGGTVADWEAGKKSMDRVVEVYTFDPDCNCYGWENTGNGTTRMDPPEMR